ncbi:MAG: acetyl-CoA C-acyltransferase, partial [Pseudomonas sp.]
SLRRTLLSANRAKGTGARLKALMGVRPSMFFKPLLPRNGEPRTGLSMGEHCEEMAKRWQIKRLAQDELTLTSHQRLDAAYKQGFFDDLISPYRGLARDNNLRADASLEKLAGLSPAYDRQNGTLTAGNSTPLTDGASVVLLASEEWAAERGLPVLAYLRTGETAAVNFVAGTEGLLMAPAYAVPRMLKREGLTFADFDLFEIHEAFAAQVLCTLKAWEDPDYCRDRLGLDAPLGSIDRSKMNVNGGSLGCGHPFAATGGRQLAALAKAIHQRGGGRGLISICAAGGLGITAIVEK